MLKGLFQRFFRQQNPHGEVDRSRADDTARQSEGLFVSIKDAKGQVIGMVDQITADYLQSSGPDPSQRALDAMLDQMTSLRVLDDGTVNGYAIGSTILLECEDPRALTELRKCLRIVEDPRTFGHCMCVGDHAIQFYAGDALIGTIGLHHGQSIRWDAWKHDAFLRDGRALLQWLAERGVAEPLEDYNEQLRRMEADQTAAERWKQAMPPCLRRYWRQMNDFSPDLGPLQKTLGRAYPDLAERILVLFAWYGQGRGPWSGCPMYERVVQELLLAFSTRDLIASLNQQGLTEAHWEGAARLFGVGGFFKDRPKDRDLLSSELKHRLLEHALNSNYPDNIARARGAFG